MPTPLEAEINSLLRESGNPSRVANELLRRWKMNLLSEDEQSDCAQFMIAAGLYPAFFRHLRHLSTEMAQLPWTQVAEAIGRAKVKPEPKEIDAILEGAEEQNAMSRLLRSYQLDLWSREFGERRARLKHFKALEAEAQKKELKDKLQFIRSQRLFDQEAKVLEEIQALFPEEPEFQAERESFEVRWARDVIARSTSVTDPTSDLEWKADRLTPEQTTSKDLIVARAKELAGKDPRHAYDLALSLHFMDFNVEALEVLSVAGAAGAAADWLRLELMIQARQFVSVLEEGARLELEHAGDPEAAFAVTYARARALKGLGEEALAIDLLRSLVKIRPHYKSAQSLLMDWTGGDI